MRGQSSAELLLVFALFTVMFLWVANFASVYSANTLASGLIVQQGQAARDIASLAGTACMYSLNLSYQLPCLTRGAPEPANITAASSNYVNISTSAGSVSEYSACRLNASLVSTCSNGYGDWVCVSGDGGGPVQMTRGRCI